MNILIKLINDVKALCNTIITAVNAIKAKTDTITADLFTSTHASRIDATISSRQANAGLTTTHASRIDASISSRASQASVDAIKSGRPIFGKVRIFTYSYPTNMPLTTVFSYSGGAGKLLFVRKPATVSFIIDGVPIANVPDYFHYGILGYNSDGYVVNFEFKQSIQILITTMPAGMAGTLQGIVITEN